jgi:hypothetical protein
MQLRDVLGQIGEKYDRRLPMSSEAQQLLRRAGTELATLVPGTYLVEGSGGKGNAAVSPWIAVFNPEETTTARRGMYVVYLYAADMSTVSLSLNQGVTEIGERLGRARARRALRDEAAVIRDAFVPEAIADLDSTIDLRTDAALPVDYEYGNIVSRTYALGDLPDEPALVTDLQRFIQLYDLALDAREEGSQRGEPAITTPPRTRPAKKKSIVFKPKDDGEYRQLIQQREIVKRRRHETLVNDYSGFLRGRGFRVSSPHPRDLMAHREGRDWLIEAKMIYAGDAETAAREAFAQLFFYEHFLCEQHVQKVALFNEAVGSAHIRFFEQMQIAVVWRDGRGWAGSLEAIADGLC